MLFYSLTQTPPPRPRLPHTKLKIRKGQKQELASHGAARGAQGEIPEQDLAPTGPTMSFTGCISHNQRPSCPRAACQLLPGALSRKSTPKSSSCPFMAALWDEPTGLMLLNVQTRCLHRMQGPHCFHSPRLLLLLLNFPGRSHQPCMNCTCYFGRVLQ